MIKCVWKLFQVWLVRFQMRVLYGTKCRPVYNLQIGLFRTQRHMSFEMPRFLLSAPQTSRMFRLSCGLRHLQFDRVSLLRPGFHVEQEGPMLKNRQSTMSTRWKHWYIFCLPWRVSSAIPLGQWSNYDRRTSIIFFPFLKQVNSGLEHSVRRVTGHVKLAATFPTKTVCLVVRRPCSNLRARAWNNVHPGFTQTCDSATTPRANRVRIRALNVCRAPTVQCVTRLCCCKPANVVQRVPQGMYIITYNI